MGNSQISGIASAEAFLSGHEPQKALDGNCDTCWAAEPYHKWWLMDCGGPVCIRSVFVKTGQIGTVVHYYIEYSADRLNWMLLAEKQGDAAETAAGETFETNITARFIRITMTYCSTGDRISLAEVKVFGEPAETEEEADGRSFPRIRAADCSEAEGFELVQIEEIEPGWADTVMHCTGAGAHLVFRAIDFSVLAPEQLRCYIYFPHKDKTLHTRIFLHLDSVDGICIGTMDLTHQYTDWVEFACDLAADISGVRDLYFVADSIDLPQELYLLWLSLDKRPVMPTRLIDGADEPATKEGAFQVFLGNMHCHTGFTDGVCSPEFAYDYAKNVANIDFLGITEHSNLFDHAFDASASRKWRDLKQMANQKTEPDVFLALMGSETTWYNQFGHMNIYGADFFINPYENKYNDPARYYETMKRFPGAINQWNHPWSCGDRHLDGFLPYDPQLDPLMCTIEINSIEVPEQDGLAYYMRALDLGWHIAPVGSQDNHKADWGTQNEIRTGIIARRLTKGDFYHALRERRTYYTCAKHLKLIYRLNDTLLGGRINPAEEYTAALEAANQPADAPFSHVQLIGEGGTILESRPLEGHSCNVSVKTKKQSKYYFLKVFQTDGKFAATAPVWTDSGGNGATTLA